MKTLRHFHVSLLVGLASCGGVQAQVLGNNLVGYINHTFGAGDSLIGNQLSAGDNSLNEIFNAGAVPNGATISVWDASSHNFLTPSVFDAASGWSINYALAPGVGALLHTPSPFANTFAGEVIGYDILNSTVILPPPPGDGTFLLACRVPLAGASFLQTVGRSPQEGDSVTRLNNATGEYFSTSFIGGEWDNGEPGLNLVEGAFFNLGVAVVPEPASWALGLLGLAGVFRRVRRGGR